MGNKLCKKKVDTSDAVDNAKTTTPFDRIITRLHLRPNSWKSDSHLNRKQVNRCEVSPKIPIDKMNNVTRIQPLSKSTDWINTDLEVPDSEETIHLRNPELSLIFNNNDDGSPKAPPRKHKKGFREKIEAVAKSGLQALQTKKPVEEPLMIKKKINYNCPLCDSDESNHNRDHHHHDTKPNKHPNEKTKANKRRKNLSVVSLPNYNELKLTVTTFDEDIDRPANPIHNSVISLPNESKKLTATASTGKLDTYITRCRSFGSLLPQQLLDKLRTRKVPADIESDDSFGALEDWDLGLIEHYNPKDASLPRPRKLPIRDNKTVLTDIESLVVEDEPIPPVRRSESLVKKLNREAVETVMRQSGGTERCRKKSPTPPPSPVTRPGVTDERFHPISLPTEVDGKVEHSSLMKILEEFSIKDKQERPQFGGEEPIPYIDKSDEVSTNEKNSIENFLNAEKVNSSKEIGYGNLKKAVLI